MIQSLVLFLIRFYQIHLSPRKGFRCAHAAVHGGASCSAAVANIVASDGVWRGLRRIEQRFGECRAAAQFIHRQPPSYSRGALDCDCGFSSCGDVPDIGSCSGGADTADTSAVGSSCFLTDLSLLFSGGLRLRTFVWCALLVLTAVFTWYAYDHGNTIESISVIKTSDLPDDELGFVDRMLSGRELRYLVVLLKSNGQQVESDVLSGDFTEGLTFRPLEDIRIGQVRNLLLQRKQVLRAETLFSVAPGESDASVDGFRIVIETNWPLFRRVLE